MPNVHNTAGEGILMQNLLFLFLLTMPISAHAYIGPGMGAGALAVIFGILGAIILGLFAILWYPLKRLFSKIRKKQMTDTKDESDSA